MKNTITILLLILSHAILLGHNIIPHHHHDFSCDFVKHEHNHVDDHQHGDHQSICVHDSGGLVFTLQQVLSIDEELQVNSIDFIFVHFIDYFESILVKQLFSKPKIPDNLRLSHLLPSGLRAPPTIDI